MEALLWIVVSTLIVSLLTLLLMRLKMGGLLLVYLLFPLLLFGYLAWFEIVAAGYFLYIKLISVCLGVLLIGALRFRHWIDYHWARVLGYLMLFINILDPSFDLLDRIVQKIK
ncbi:hypothetical protein D5085_00125 [Ectothiorhodospiraceae bacterium BW-2]|nr:hypothetical protein D5085_00125 [Ectothiorhodospiraceae bacterium BW-2]